MESPAGITWNAWPGSSGICRLLAKVVELIEAFLVVKAKGAAELGVVELNPDLFRLLDNGLPVQGDLPFNGLNVFKLLAFLGLKGSNG